MDWTKRFKSTRKDDEQMEHDELAAIAMENRKLSTENKEGIAILAEQIKAAFKRIDEQKALTESVHKIATTQEVMVKEIERQGKEHERLRTDLDALRLKPATRWDGAVSQIITIVIAAVVGWMIKHFAG